MQHQHHIYDLCKKHMHHYVLFQTTSGEQIDGIITDLDDQNVYLAVPTQEHSMSRDEERQLSPYGVGYGPGYGPGPRPPYGPGPRPPYGPGPRPPYGPYPGYGGYPPYGPRPAPFQRLVLPLAALTALSVLPWF